MHSSTNSNISCFEGIAKINSVQIILAVYKASISLLYCEYITWLFDCVCVFNASDSNVAFVLFVVNLFKCFYFSSEDAALRCVGQIWNHLLYIC